MKYIRETMEYYLWFWISALTMTAFIYALSIVSTDDFGGFTAFMTFIASMLVGSLAVAFKLDEVEYRKRNNE